MSDEIDYGVDPELVLEFVDESEELLGDVTNLFIALESNPNDRESIDKIFRTVHTIKGNSAFFNLMKVKSLAHVMEDLMNLVRDGNVKFNEDISDVLIRGIDALKEILENVRGQKSEVSDEEEYTRLVNEITEKVNAGKQQDPLVVWKIVQKDVESFNKGFSSEDKSLMDNWTKIASNLLILSPLTDQEVASTKESVEESTSVETEGVASEKVSDESKSKDEVKEKEKKGSQSNKTMRVYESSIDSFLDFVGELVVVGEMYDHIQKRFSEDLGPIKSVANLKKNNETFNELSTALQRSVLDIRRVPIKTLLQRAPRIVRDVATAKGKKIKVHTEGEQILIDKSLLENLEGPFVHMVRNAADHGVEKVEKRKEAGKAEEGNIYLTISENEDLMFIEIKDDGAGINREIILNKAIENGLLTKDSAENLSDENVYQLLFAPGFSTAEEITDISGRGVGMDVVKKNVDSIGGHIRIESVLGEGSIFTIEIPKTVCVKIMEGFLVSIKGNKFVLPMTSVGESFKILAEEITSTLGQGECIMHHGLVFPVTRLDKLLNLSGEYEKEEKIGVILDMGKKEKMVLLVDDVLGTQQVVIKHIEGLPEQSPLISGGAVLGDEKVAIVLNLEDI